MRSITSAIVGAVAATAILTGSLAIAAIPNSTSRVITSCYDRRSGALRVIDKQAGAACNTRTETELAWNQTGPKGDIGLTGAPGVAGIKGDPGTPGVNGLPGVQGDAGTNGLPGAKGDPGVPGSNGLEGAPGAPGPAGKDGVGGAPVMYDATGAVVGTPVYPTTDIFWTGEYMVRYDTMTGKLPRTHVYYLASDCTGDAFADAQLSFLGPQRAAGKPLAAVSSTDVGTIVIPQLSPAGGLPSFTQVIWRDAFQYVTGTYVTLLSSGSFTNVRIGDLPYQLDLTGACVPGTPPDTNFGTTLVPATTASVQGLHDFTGPIAPALVAMPG